MISYPLLASLSVETGAAPHIPWQVLQRIPTMLLGQPHWLLFLNTTGLLGTLTEKMSPQQSWSLTFFTQNPSH